MNELPGRFLKRQHYAEHVRTHYIIQAPVGMQPDDFLKPGFWVHHVTSLRPLDLVEIISEDGSFEMQLRVRDFLTVRNGDNGSVTRTGVIMRELKRQIFGEIAKAPEPVEKEEPKQIGNLTITWGGPTHKWRILDGTRLISKGHKSREDAETAAEDYLSQLAAVA